MARRNSDLALPVTIALVVLGLSLAGVLPRADGLGLLLVVPLVTVCPGRAMVAALRVGHMDALARALLVLAVSLAWTLLVGLVLHVTPLGLSGPSFAGALAMIIVAWTVIARRRPRDVPSEPTASSMEAPPHDGRPAATRLLFAAAASMTLAAIAVSVWGARHVGRPLQSPDGRSGRAVQ